ncbi:RNA polymerase sigma factor [Allorhizocola rhizosphaerae]|uniref:RNA polymerase sigma factor n=1 Tax=Allorhizocola rhizosphaerae TaxID=1872709 RepID=UPI0013C3138B|nr:RNA polymerase sigma factor [Allorhizocola rhizosphaerae]
MDELALVAAIVKKDPQGLEIAYRRYADPLYAYARGLIGDGDAAADIVHDTFLLASEHVAQLRDPARLRQWLYAIARNEGLRQIKQRSRHTPLEFAPDVPADTVDPSAGASSQEVAELVRAAMAGMSDGDREVAELALRHNLSTTDIAEVLDVPINNVRARLSRAREQLTIALGVLLVARHNDGACATLAEMLTGWDGKLNPLLRKRLHRHIEDCEICTDTRRKRLNPAALLPAYGAAPFAPMLLMPPGDGRPTPAPPKWNRVGFPTQGSPRTRVVVVAAAVAVLLAGGGGSAWVFAQSSGSGQTPVAAVSSSPTPSASPTASPSPTPSPSVEPSPSMEPSPSPSVRPSRSRTPSPTPPAPLAFDANGTCAGPDAAGGYTLSVTATANADLQSAQLFHGSAAAYQMQINDKTATITRRVPAGGHTWQVEVKATDGRTLLGPFETTRCGG